MIRLGGGLEVHDVLPSVVPRLRSPPQVCIPKYREDRDDYFDFINFIDNFDYFSPSTWKWKILAVIWKFHLGIILPVVGILR